MSTFARIARLHRELAEAYEELDRAAQPKPRKILPVKSREENDKTREVRAALRRMGVKTG